MLRRSRSKVRTDLAPGTRIGKQLRVERELGRGASAVVYEALHTRLNARVAVKVLDVAPEWAHEATLRLEREARVCALINDPHVPKVFDVGELADGRPYIVLERVHGQTLENMLLHGPLEPFIALEIARELTLALRAVHEAGVVHRDVKPANVLVRREGGALHVCLMDFGVSTKPSGEVREPTITYQGTIVGTPLYMAPEQLTDEGTDARADLYAVGVILYEMLTGKTPFSGQNSVEVMAAVLRHDFPPIETYWKEAPKKVSAFVTRALAQSPADRFASATDMLEGLIEQIELVDEHDRASVLSTSISVPKNVRTYATALTAIGMVAVALATGFAVLPEKTAAPKSRPLRQVHPAAAAGEPPALDLGAANETRAPIARTPQAVRPRLMEMELKAPEVEAATFAESPPEPPRPRATAKPDDPSPKSKRAQGAEPPVTSRGEINMTRYLRDLDGLRESLDSVAGDSVAPVTQRAHVERTAEAIPQNPFE